MLLLLLPPDLMNKVAKIPCSENWSDFGGTCPNSKVKETCSVEPAVEISATSQLFRFPVAT